MPNRKNSKYNLEERTALFAENLIVFLKGVKENTLNRTIVNQLIRSGTSIGANYCEADGAESKKDFQHKIGICKKEAKETKYWIHMLSILHPEKKSELRVLWKESQELTLIFSKIIINSRGMKQI
ncbi:MAG: four helix bundle protein [Candidatus Moraniibacteriota bacterium]